jgi:hypothetical protein
MDVFIGLCGQVRNGLDSSSKGEGRWALSLARCLKDYGHRIVMAPDMELCSWGDCQVPDNVLMIQAYEKRKLCKAHFDVAIFTSWLTRQEESHYINADKYVWGVIGWKGEVMRDGFFKDNDYVARWTRDDLPTIPFPINFKDRCFLLAQPFGKGMGKSKFDNKRVGWVAKEAFASNVPLGYSESAARHLFATVDACKETGSSLSIFSCHEFNPENFPRVMKLGVYDKLKELDKVTMHPSLSFPEYTRELHKCSVTIPVMFAGSIQESLFSGILPLLYRDSMFVAHPQVKGVAAEMTNNKSSITNESTQDEIKNKVMELLTDRNKFDYYLEKLQPMVVDNLDDSVVSQLMDIMNHRNRTDNIRR